MRLAPAALPACVCSTTTFTVDVDLTDGQTHDLELYFLDWDSTSRSEQVTISNASTGVVLSTELVSSFHSGVYLAWDVSGNVLITITYLSGANAVLSGVFLNPTATAEFAASDGTTEGNWKGTYGTQAYDVIGNTESLPSYATITTTGTAIGTAWAATTTDPRALEDAVGTSTIASGWFSTTSFTVNVDMTDGQVHDLELYFLDWDSTARAEEVTVSNAVSGEVFSQVLVSSFHSGVYKEWAVSGDVLITITDIAGASAVLSGLFLDPWAAPSASSVSLGSASLVGTNTTSEGNWIGTYGTQGYDVFGNAESLPSYATITTTGTPIGSAWATTTTDPRALEDAVGTSSIASGVCSSTTFTVDVDLTDGQTHDLELYFLDWDSTSRSEQVILSNAATGTLLDSEVVSSFHTGVFLEWAVSGNILITFTDIAGTNAVLSGLFLDPYFSTGTSASFVGTNSSTEGNWIGTYGSQGYDVFGNAESLPSYATITTTGTPIGSAWATTTTDPRALEDAVGTSRIASGVFAHGTFTVTVDLTDGQTHDLELYFLDWDSINRTEDVTISSVASGAVLDSEVVSQFHSGVYLEWAVSGDILITFTQVGGANAVLSGVFLDPGPVATSTAGGGASPRHRPRLRSSVRIARRREPGSGNMAARATIWPRVRSACRRA